VVVSYLNQKYGFDLPAISAGDADNTINDRLVISKFSPLSSVVIEKIKKYLTYTGFPVTKNDLCKFADKNGAEPEVISKLMSLRRTLYDSYSQIQSEMI